MRQVKEEVCLYYMGAGCSQYKASGVKIGKKSKVVTGKRA